MNFKNGLLATLGAGVILYASSASAQEAPKPGEKPADSQVVGETAASTEPSYYYSPECTDQGQPTCQKIEVQPETLAEPTITPKPTCEEQHDRNGMCIQSVYADKLGIPADKRISIGLCKGENTTCVDANAVPDLAGKIATFEQNDSDTEDALGALDSDMDGLAGRVDAAERGYSALKDNVDKLRAEAQPKLTDEQLIGATVAGMQCRELIAQYNTEMKMVTGIDAQVLALQRDIRASVSAEGKEMKVVTPIEGLAAGVKAPEYSLTSLGEKVAKYEAFVAEQQVRVAKANAILADIRDGCAPEKETGVNAQLYAGGVSTLDGRAQSIEMGGKLIFPVRSWLAVGVYGGANLQIPGVEGNYTRTDSKTEAILNGAAKQVTLEQRTTLPIARAGFEAQLTPTDWFTAYAGIGGKVDEETFTRDVIVAGSAITAEDSGMAYKADAKAGVALNLGPVSVSGEARCDQDGKVSGAAMLGYTFGK